MKVSLDCIIFGLQRFGGISTYWSQLALYLAGKPDIEVEQIWPRSFLNLATAETLEANAGERRPDHRPNQVARFLRSPATRAQLQHSSYYRLPARRDTRSVITVYDFVYEFYRGGVVRAMHSRHKFHAIRSADAVICISENTRRDLLRLCPDKDPAKVHVTPLAYDRARFRPVLADARDPDMRRSVLFVGQRDGYKQFGLAISSIAQVPEASLRIIGPPLRPEETERLARQLPGRWSYAGSVPDERLRVEYASSLGLIYPSDYEGFGLPILEAMACGTPVVCAPSSSIPEVGGEAALYARTQTPEAYAEHLGALLDDDHRNAASRAGLARASAFSWTDTFERTIAIYREVIG